MQARRLALAEERAGYDESWLPKDDPFFSLIGAFESGPDEPNDGSTEHDTYLYGGELSASHVSGRDGSRRHDAGRPPRDDPFLA